MDIQPQAAQQAKPISDDQELAKVLAGISQDANPNLDFEETPMPTPLIPSPMTQTATPQMPAPAPMPTPAPAPSIPQPFTNQPAPAPIGYTPPVAAAPVANTSLDGIRKDALLELRPLVDKLDLAPEEKFDIYLLLLRSTDDIALIAPAHEAAKNIADESRRAQALLDVIKEIDFLSVPQQVSL